MQDRVTHKTSTILISTGGKLQSFRSLSEVPRQMRERLIQSTSGPYSATLLIADEGGRREVLRSLSGQPSAVESRWMRSYAGRDALTGDSAEPDHSLVETTDRSRRWRRVAEISLLMGIGICLWLLAAWR